MEPLHADALASVRELEGVVAFIVCESATFGIVLSQVGQFVVPAQLLHRASRCKTTHRSASQIIPFRVVIVQYQVHILGSHFDQHRPTAIASEFVDPIAGYVTSAQRTQPCPTVIWRFLVIDFR